MKVLFVCSGNSPNGISPIVKNQGESLRKNGIELDYFSIKGRGFRGYLKNIILLRKYLRKNKYDLIHAHYALSGWVSVLTFVNIPIVVSYMGCDTYGDYNEKGRRTKSSYINIILARLLQPFVKVIIVKSKNLEKLVYLKTKVHLIPNGVNFEIFKPIDKNKARKLLRFDYQRKYVLFLGNPGNKHKNIFLLREAQKLCNEEFEILNSYPISHEQIPLYLSACDVLVLTSYNEGSPNVIKEAMACNCPIVSTDVGDVKKVIGNTEGCYICSYDPEDVAEKIKKALDYAEMYNRTDGRNRIIELGIDSDIVAKKIMKIYQQVFY